MYSLLMLPLVAGNLALLAWVLRCWARSRDPLWLVLLVPLVMLPYDTALVALGGTLGIGDTLRILSIPRVNWFYLSLPLLIIVSGGVARRAGLAWPSRRWVMGGLCGVATLLVLLDWRRIVTVPDLYPACYGDMVRYVTAVPEAQRCLAEQGGVGLPPDIPWGGALTLLVVLGTGVALAWRRRWPWLLVGNLLSGVMLQLPHTVVGPYGIFLGDFLSMGAMVWALAHFTGPARAPKDDGWLDN